jgi:hypothetical protein
VLSFTRISVALQRLLTVLALFCVSTALCAQTAPTGGRPGRDSLPAPIRCAIASTSADGYIARPDGDLEWLTSRPKPRGFYGMSDFMNSIDTKLIGRKTYEMSRRLGANSGCHCGAAGRLARCWR